MIPEWIIDCLNSIRTWLKNSQICEITITDDGVRYKVRSNDQKNREA